VTTGQLTSFGTHDGKSLHFLVTYRLEDFPSYLDLPSEHLALLLVYDAQNNIDLTIGSVAKTVVEEELRCVCTWGPACKRVRNLFENEGWSSGLDCADNETTVMTTWHEHETLDEAL